MNEHNYRSDRLKLIKVERKMREGRCFVHLLMIKSFVAQLLSLASSILNHDS